MDDLYAEKNALSQMEFSDKYDEKLVKLDGKANQVEGISAVRGLGKEGIQKLKEFYGDDPWFYELEEAFYIEMGGENGTKAVNCIFSSHPMHGDKLKSIEKGAGIMVRGRYMETVSGP